MPVDQLNNLLNIMIIIVNLDGYKTKRNEGGKQMKLAHITINVKNMNESLKFYEEIVGLPVVNRFTAGPNMEIVFLGLGETLVELIHDTANNNISIGNDISIGFAVDCLDETIEFVKEKGININSGPFQPNPNTRFFFVLDPNGLKVQFIEQK